MKKQEEVAVVKNLTEVKPPQMTFQAGDRVTYPAGRGGRAKGRVRSIDNESNLAVVETESGKTVQRRFASLEKITE